MTQVTQDQLLQLQQWDTPTICNGLEIIDPESRNSGFTLDPFVCLNPAQQPVVGYAVTAHIRAKHAPTQANHKEVRMQYYEYVASNPTPSVVAIQDLDEKPGAGAFWGEVNTHIHLGLGVLGCITNGSMRDLPDSAAGFQLLAGTVGPSHANVHVENFKQPVSIHGLSIQHGDIIHMDQHGAVIVPEKAVTKLPEAIAQITRKESIIITAAKKPDFSFEKLQVAMEAASRTT